MAGGRIRCARRRVDLGVCRYTRIQTTGSWRHTASAPRSSNGPFSQSSPSQSKEFEQCSRKATEIRRRFSAKADAKAEAKGRVLGRNEGIALGRDEERERFRARAAEARHKAHRRRRTSAVQSQRARELGVEQSLSRSVRGLGGWLGRRLAPLAKAPAQPPSSLFALPSRGD